jgi:hypothetical protein
MSVAYYVIISIAVLAVLVLCPILVNKLNSGRKSRIDKDLPDDMYTLH